METKHTPGPWKYEVDYSDRRPKIIVEIPMKPFSKKITFGAIGEDDCPSPECCNTEAHANAKVAAAAPEMLQALSELLDEVAKQCSIGSDPKLRVLMDKWQAGTQAIKKATE